MDQSDFEDKDDLEEAEEVQQEPGKRGRGPDKEWFEEGVYQNMAGLDESEYNNNLDKEITKKYQLWRSASTTWVLLLQALQKEIF